MLRNRVQFRSKDEQSPSSRHKAWALVKSGVLLPRRFFSGNFVDNFDKPCVPNPIYGWKQLLHRSPPETCTKQKHHRLIRNKSIKHLPSSAYHLPICAGWSILYQPSGMCESWKGCGLSYALGRWQNRRQSRPITATVQSSSLDRQNGSAVASTSDFDTKNHQLTLVRTNKWLCLYQFRLVCCRLCLLKLGHQGSTTYHPRRCFRPHCIHYNQI